MARSTVNLNHCNSEGLTPLHKACQKDKPDCVKALLLAGADVNISAQDVSNVYNRGSVQTSKSSLINIVIFLTDDNN